MLLKEHTTKGWKYKARDGEIPTELPHNACEEGKDAIPHSDLVSELQKCCSVSISTFQTFLFGKLIELLFFLLIHATVLFIGYHQTFNCIL